MGGDRRARTVALADLEHDHRLAGIGRAPLEQVGAATGRLHPIRIHVRQGELADLTGGGVGALRRPVPERRAEAVRHGPDPEVPQQLGDRVVAERATERRGKDQVRILRKVARLVQDFERACGEQHPVIALRLHAARRHRPGLRFEIDFLPSGEPDLAGPAGRQQPHRRYGGRPSACRAPLRHHGHCSVDAEQLGQAKSQRTGRRLNKLPCPRLRYTRGRRTTGSAGQEW